MSSKSNNLCLSKDIDAEVELISLTFEKLPRYRLKADCNVQFSGYQHSDFKLAEQVPKEITELSNEQIEKTLEYFLLCGLRVCKMTETYEDCAALRLLVEEQKAHMDEAANIGLNLLQRNIQLEQRLNVVEGQLDASKDTINQLKHQLHLKDDLLRLLHSEIEEAEDSNCTHNDSSLSLDTGFPLEKVNLKRLESKLSKLEEENTALRSQQLNLNTNTDILENKEQQLIDDCVRQLLDSTKTVERLSSELNKKTNDYLNQHEEISRLLTTNIDLDNKIHQLLTDNDNLSMQCRDHQTKQFTLTKELSELRDRYDECINLLNEKQDEIRLLKKKCKREMMKNIPGFRSNSPDVLFAPSLAMEFDDSNRRECAMADQARAMRVMEQARTVNSASLLDADETSSSGFNEDLSCSIMTHTETESPVTGGNYLLRKSIQEDCEKRRMLRNNPLGMVDSASMMESSQMADDASGGSGSNSTIASYCTLEAYRHRQNRCQTIQSLNTHILNSESNFLHSHSFYRIPDKLQLVKPIEGSQTLRTWQNLATPSITKALFEEQSHSVCFRGQQPLVLSPSPPSPNSDHSRSTEIAPSLRSSVLSSDYDDADYDDPVTVAQSKCPSSTSDTSSTCTYTNSRMLLPTQDPHSPMTGHGSFTSHVAGPAVTSHRRDSTSAFSLNLVESSNALSPSLDRHVQHHPDDTPVNEMFSGPMAGSGDQTHDTDLNASTPSGQRTMPSWLDRLTVKSIMTNILGYPLPHLQRSSTCNPYSMSTTIHHTPIMAATVAVSPSFCSSSPVSSSSPANHPSSIIGRLTNLPPLAQRRYPQSGLNLLTSVASSHSYSPDRVLHRVGGNDDTDPLESPQSGISQLD